MHRLLTCIGALIERKGQGIAIEALRDVPGARLVLVGKGEDEARLRMLAISEKVADRVAFAGSVDHDLMPLILSAADVDGAADGERGGWRTPGSKIACLGTPVVHLRCRRRARADNLGHRGAAGGGQSGSGGRRDQRGAERPARTRGSGRA